MITKFLFDKMVYFIFWRSYYYINKMSLKLIVSENVISYGKSDTFTIDITDMNRLLVTIGLPPGIIQDSTYIIKSRNESYGNSEVIFNDLI